jgi:hypothetical protein
MIEAVGVASTMDVELAWLCGVGLGSIPSMSNSSFSRCREDSIELVHDGPSSARPAARRFPTAAGVDEIISPPGRKEDSEGCLVGIKESLTEWERECERTRWLRGGIEYVCVFGASGNGRSRLVQFCRECSAVVSQGAGSASDSWSSSSAHVLFLFGVLKVVVPRHAHTRRHLKELYPKLKHSGYQSSVQPISMQDSPGQPLSLVGRHSSIV